MELRDSPHDSYIEIARYAKRRVPRAVRLQPLSQGWGDERVATLKRHVYVAQLDGTSVIALNYIMFIFIQYK